MEYFTKQAEIIKIQSWWRSVCVNTTSRLINSLLLNGLTITYCKAITFESLLTLLRQRYMITITKKCLDKFKYLSSIFHEIEVVIERKTARLFLASYLIAFKKEYVFDNPNGELEVLLFDSANVLINAFEKICVKLSIGECFHNIDKELTQSLYIVFIDYLDKFKKWQSFDEIKLIGRIKHVLFALLEAKANLSPDDFNSIEIRDRIDKLRMKLVQIGGENADAEFEEYSSRLLYARSIKRI